MIFVDNVEHLFNITVRSTSFPREKNPSNNQIPNNIYTIPTIPYTRTYLHISKDLFFLFNNR